jgi:hypothetical protein
MIEQTDSESVRPHPVSVQRRYWERMVPFALAAVVVTAWAAWLFFGAKFAHRVVALPVAAGASAPTVAELGQVGDLFGGINALFAALAAAGVFWAGYLQRRTLIETREALEIQFRDERTRFERQQFESNFFQLFSLQRELAANMMLHLKRPAHAGGETPVTPEMALNHVVGNSAIKLWPVPDPGKALIWYEDGAKADVLDPNMEQLRPLFRTFAETLTYLGAARKSFADVVQRYTALAKAQLGDPLLVFFALHALTEPTGRYKALVEQFQLLDSVAHREDLSWAFSSAYSLSAFGE